MKSVEKHIRQLSYQQRRAVDLWIDGGRKSKAKALRKASYSEAVARQPDKVFSSPAVKRLLELRGLGARGIESSYIPKKEIDVQEKANIKNQPVFDPSKLSAEQIDWLRGEFAKLPEVFPYSSFVPKQEEIPSYTPRGIGIDAFSAEAKEQYDRHFSLDNSASFSSM